MFICPVCGSPLTENERIYLCPNGHSFDRARSGYVNLLQSQASGKRHGDDKRMIAARTAFLETDSYRPLLDCLTRLSAKYAPKRLRLLDIGCGEGWYTEGIRKALTDAGHCVEAYGIDISKDALAAAGKRSKDLRLAVASVSHLPLPDNSCSELINVFAPIEPKEFARVISPNGFLLRAIPLERHLLGLKSLIYDTPYLNRVEPVDIPGWTLAEEEQVCYTLNVDDAETIRSLFWMTPYAYKTGADDQKKLDNLTHLITEIAFAVRVYKPAL